MQTNLLKETEEILTEHGLTFNYIKFIANAEGAVEIATFVSLAKEFYYDNATQDIDVDPTLVIVGGNWWLSRGFYEGCEKWVFHRKPQRPSLDSVDFKINIKRSSNHINSK